MWILNNEKINPDTRVKGRGGQDLYDYFDSRGGPEAYLGTTIPGFPNYFTILGKVFKLFENTFLLKYWLQARMSLLVMFRHSSVKSNRWVSSRSASTLSFSLFIQILYALQLIKPVIEGKAKSFEVRREVSEGYNTDLQKRLSETVWTSCKSYYRQGNNGTSNDGKIVATFPGSLFRQWRITRYVDWNAFVGVDAEAWERERKKQGTLTAVKKVVLGMMFAGLAVGLRMNSWDFENLSAVVSLAIGVVEEKVKAFL